MNSNDLECLAKLLDKNHEFVRPKGQVTGYSCDENTEAAVVAKVTNHDTTPHSMSIPLPHTVVDQQLRLPVPSHSKAAEKEKALEATKMQPRGEEIWSQAELEMMYDVQTKQTERKNAVTRTVANKEESNVFQNNTANTNNNDGDAVAEPEYRILYQQQVRAEDVYLGVDFTRDSSVASSEAVVVKIELPLLSNANDISLDLQPFQLKLSAPHYYLSTPLPTAVNTGSAIAKWDKASSTLTITCTVVKDPKAVKILS